MASTLLVMGLPRQGIAALPFADGLPVTVSSLLGSTADDASVAAAVRSDGQPVFVGRTCGDDFPTRIDLRGVADGCALFVATVARDGSRLNAATTFGGSGDDVIADVALDAADHIYVVGWTTSADFPIRNGFQPTIAGDADVFIARFDAAAGWSTFLGGLG